ncbi:FecR domain-containing protein [Novosphingobium sp. P6W]|uniref:FecR family protein n=1 Tax=Novosphingobium sp. P6W TaxID=1609758 RepID=UPI000A49992C|nr:FecR domain-containing protein [Novosphingobium sp. P6W]
MDRTRVEQEALEWLVRLGDPRFENWESLTSWLAMSPEHADVFNTLQLAEAEALDHLQSVETEAVLPANSSPDAPTLDEAANDNPVADRRLWPFVACAVAIACIGLWLQTHGKEAAGEIAWQEYRTASGGLKELQLADGSKLALNGDTFVRIAANGREATLDTGEAFFTVRHDPEHPFVVRAGGALITDVGTRFNVTRDGDGVTIAVEHGEVALTTNGQDHMNLIAGQGATLTGGHFSKFRIASDDVAGWTKGRLQYDSAPLTRVIADVTRTTGLRIKTRAGGDQRRFTGTIRTDGSRKALRERIAILLDAEVEEPIDRGAGQAANADN